MSTSFDWSDAAETWEAKRGFVEGMKAALTAKMIDAMALSPGDAVLELGAGVGDLALQLADLVAPGGNVLATDLAPGMVEAIRRAASAAPNVQTSVMDAAATGLEPASYDAIACRMTLMLLPDVEAALLDWRRVLRPGGRLAAAVWDAPEHNVWLVALGMAAMIHGAVSGPPPTDPGSVFSLGSAEALEKAVCEAGFVSVAVRTIELQASFADSDEHFEMVSGMAAPLRQAIASAAPEVRQAIKETAAEIIAPYRTDACYLIPAQALLVTAVA